MEYQQNNARVSNNSISIPFLLEKQNFIYESAQFINASKFHYDASTWNFFELNELPFQKGRNCYSFLEGDFIRIKSVGEVSRSYKNMSSEQFHNKRIKWFI